MSWSVGVRMVRRERDGLYHVVVDDCFDELKCLYSSRAQSGFDQELCSWSSSQELNMPDEARVLFEVSHPDNEDGIGIGKYTEIWNYYTRDDCWTIVNKAEAQYQKWFLRLSKVKEYMDSKKYMSLTPKQKSNVKEELAEAEEMFDGEGLGAQVRFRAAMSLWSLWLKYYDYDGAQTWLGVRTE